MIRWTYSPGRSMPYESECKHFLIGIDFNGFHQAIKSERTGRWEPIGPPCVTPDEAKAVCERVGT